MPSAIANACMECGACCAAYRVSFYWTEGDDAGGTVPAALTQDLPPHRRCMAGTDAHAPRCVALRGEVGSAVSCSIYGQRPSTCREFIRDGQDGRDSPECTRARAKFGLPPLRRPGLPGA